MKENDGPQTFSELLEEYKAYREWVNWKLLWCDKKFHELLKLITSGEYKQMTHDEIVDRIAMNICIADVDGEDVEEMFEVENKFDEYFYDEETGKPRYF